MVASGALTDAACAASLPGEVDHRPAVPMLSKKALGFANSQVREPRSTRRSISKLGRRPAR
jgi:hypothetical protein